MPALELIHDDIFMQAEAGILETFVLGSAEARRIPLRRLLVRGSAQCKQSAVLTFGSGPADQPLSEWLAKTPVVPRTWQLYIRAEDEPAYRDFFAGVARSCDRRISQAAGSVRPPAGRIT